MLFGLRYVVADSDISDDGQMAVRPPYLGMQRMSSTQQQSGIHPSGITTRSESLELGVFALERSQAYWLLSRLFLKAPDEYHLLQLQNNLSSVFEHGPLDELRNEVDACLGEAGPALAEFMWQLGGTNGTQDREPPYESFVREGRIPGVATQSVIACMREAGFSDIVHEAPSPDHIGIELKFMAIQCYEEWRAWTAGRYTDSKRLVDAQRHFLARHLAAWAPEYCERLEERTSHNYVRAIARLTRRCLISEIAAVEALFMRVHASEHHWHHVHRHRPTFSQ